MHSCRKVPVDKHFENKPVAKKLFDYLIERIEKEIGQCKIVSIPCCVHLFGTFDFLAALPKKDRLEIRFGLNRIPNSKRIKQTVPLSSKSFKICLEITNKDDMDEELMGWIEEAYNLK